MFHLHTRTQQTCFDYGLLGFLFLLRAKWWFPVVPHQTNAQKQNDTRNTKDMETKLRHTKPPFGIYNIWATKFLTFVRNTINCKYTFTSPSRYTDYKNENNNYLLNVKSLSIIINVMYEFNLTSARLAEKLFLH